MSSPLLQAAAPEALAARGEALGGTVPLGAARRLAQFVRESLAVCTEPEPAGWRERPVQAQLRFGFVRAGDGTALPAVQGRAEVTLPVSCDRCLGLLELELTADIDYVLPETDAQADTLEGFDVWVVDDRGLKPLDLVEEELLLGVPLARTHAGRCGGDRAETAGNGGDKTTRPFRDLRRLMGRDDTQGG